MNRRPPVQVEGQIDVFEVLAAIEQENAQPEPATAAGPARAPHPNHQHPEGGDDE
jgi:hypothetical protein